jgi:hypothetical protein
MELIDRVIEAMGAPLVEAWNGRTVLLGSGFAGVISLAPPVDTSEVSQVKAESLARLVDNANGVERREWTSLGELALWVCQVDSDGANDAQLVLGVPFNRQLCFAAVRAMSFLGESSDAVYLELAVDRLVDRVGGKTIEARYLRASLIRPEARATFVIAQLATGDVGGSPFEPNKATRPAAERAP